MLLLVFNRILADRGLLGFIQDADGESPDGAKLTGLGADLRPVAHIKIPSPYDSQRHLIAAYLRYLAGNFVIYHEMAHHLQGLMGYQRRHLAVQRGSSASS